MAGSTVDQPSVYELLRLVQIELNAPKGQRNTFGNYDYRSAEDILEAVKPLLADNNLTLKVSDTLELIGERYYVKATAAVYDTTGSSIEATAYAREAEDKKGMDSAQVTGATSSYARKYALNGLFAIDDAKDADTDEHKRQSDNRTSTTSNPEPSRGSSVRVPSQKQLDLIKKLAKEAGHDDDRIAGVLDKIKTSSDASAVIDKLMGSSGDQTEREYR